MTGPEHYRAAEQLLETPTDLEGRALAVAEAQVHATLALAAATALGGSVGSEFKKWLQVAR